MRADAWRERTRDPFEDAKQKRRRLLGRVRPRQPATHTDPWQVALEGLHELGVAKAHLGVDDRRRLEIACEALRRLAWGPDG